MPHEGAALAPCLVALYHSFADSPNLMPKKRSREILERFWLLYGLVLIHPLRDQLSIIGGYAIGHSFFLETLKRNEIGLPISKSDQEPLNANEPLPLLVNTQFFYNPFK